VKVSEETAVPPGVVTEIVPLAAPLGTTTETCVELALLNKLASTLPNLTAEAPDKLDPVMATMSPIAPEFGEKELMTGAGVPPPPPPPPPPHAKTSPRIKVPSRASHRL
jgi:hypothetical protein